MKSIVYLSEAITPFSESALRELTETSSANNEKLGVHGYLCYQGGRFLQYLEGSEEALDSLIEKIEKDPRHRFLYCMDQRELTNPRFSGWSMRHINNSELAYLNMEHHVETNMLYLKENYSDKGKCADFVWRQIENIARYGGQL